MTSEFIRSHDDTVHILMASTYCIMCCDIWQKQIHRFLSCKVGYLTVAMEMNFVTTVSE